MDNTPKRDGPINLCASHVRNMYDCMRHTSKCQQREEEKKKKKKRKRKRAKGKNAASVYDVC